jgi:uncharacterized protein (TIGR02117 family)
MQLAAARRCRFALLGSLIAGALAGCAATSARPEIGTGAPEATLYVIGRGWHTDVGLPVPDIAGPLAILAQSFPGVRVLVFGFGERAYLLSRDKGLAEMLRALFPGPGAMLVTALSTAPAAAFGPSHVIAFRLSRARFNRVAAFLWSYLKHDRQGTPEPIAPGPYPGSMFYASNGTYSLGYTCNTWTAEALRSGGLPIAVSGVLFAGQVWRQVRQIAASKREQPTAPAGVRD